MLQFIILAQFILATAVQSECLIDPLRIRPTPLILDRNLEIIYSNPGSGTATVNRNDEILIACPGNRLLRDNVPMGESIWAKCGGDDKLSVIGGQEIDFYSLQCQDTIKDSIRYTQKSCREGGEEIEIGFSIHPEVFIRQMSICFDNVNFTPVFSHYNLTSNIGWRDSHVPRKFFEEDGFYSTSQSLDNLYRRDNERRTINHQLDLDDSSEMYIKRNGELFINRGHLTAKGDFVYGFQQLATFHYVNSAPQWASFNGGNWNELEISLRDYAGSRTSPLEIYTGVHGVSSLKNERTKEKTNLFLHTSGRYLLPVPQLFWKLVYSRDDDKALVVLGVNNAYEFDPKEDVICDDISDKVSWFNSKLNSQKRRIDLGYTYACSFPDFRRRVAKSPVLNGRNLLL